MFMKLTSGLSLAILASMPCFGEAYSFAVVQPSDVAGPPSGLVGWGYVLSNESQQDWLVTTGLNSDGFLYGTGTPLFDFPVLSPNSDVTVPYDPALQAGLYELRWDENAPNNWINSGDFTLSAEWWTGDPGNGGIFIGFATDAMQPYSAAVQATPEPSAWLLAFAGLVSSAILQRRSKRATMLLPAARS